MCANTLTVTFNLALCMQIRPLTLQHVALSVSGENFNARKQALEKPDCALVCFYTPPMSK